MHGKTSCLCKGVLSFDTELEELNIATRANTMMTALSPPSSYSGGNSWGGGGGGAGGLWPPNFWPTTLFSGFSHTTDRKVPSEVVLMGSFMSVIYGNVR